MHTVKNHVTRNTNDESVAHMHSKLREGEAQSLRVDSYEIRTADKFKYTMGIILKKSLAVWQHFSCFTIMSQCVGE